MARDAYYAIDMYNKHMDSEDEVRFAVGEMDD
jgi:hypothetical protein